MHDQQHGPAHGQSPHRLDDPRLRLAVQARGRFVEQQQRAVGEEGPRQCEPLALSGGEARAVLADERPGSVRQFRHEIVCPGVPQCGRHRAVVGVRPGEPYVLRDGAREEVRALRYPGDPFPPALGGERRQIGAADPYPSLVGRREAEDHIEQGGLPDAAGADQGHGLPLVHHQ